mmetsp:Transcript_26196/g.56174  ORF Transcript_26196/g.56174 Transcript_26196/m.56174 type:complete len:241 (+) Transcript_26196:67-789(+)|eukprot:CAMPEP_0201116114 /NCGR_PEP_ID=MMETSP0850-20130426/486_1 /ASSEMBLY_ACC=CAM_ASM_000622 /TAXON_ID=183588 /ORGANISM="Pseudo-nitzschia fraudulenta, Strain WWA7" /LENGTH=240 /DNA_ID=CAMNT_0047380113 /DNA_START=55 /DNA_END=777 /DNA_ORIENTATION=+
MSLFKKLKDDSKSNAMGVLDSSVARVEEMHKMYAELFHYGNLSEASKDFKASATVAANEKVAQAIATTLDQLAAHATLLNTVDYFISLHVPKIEDGGNFGVGVQLDLVKKLVEKKKMVTEAVDDLLKYNESRANALTKLKLPTTETFSSHKEDVTDEDGKTGKVELTSKGLKKSSSAEGPVYEACVAAVVAVDTLYYSKAGGVFSEIIISLVTIMDFIDKNKDKLVEPKGKSGGSAFSMY